jgi:DUF3027 family protein
MISTAEFINLVSPLLGMTISLPWRGHGSAVFLELGELQPLSHPRQRHQDGEACISLEWDWRLESEKQIICGSSNSSPEIEKAIANLRNQKVEAITLDGRIPELIIDLSDGYILRSMAMTSGYPQWSVRLPDETYLSADEGVLIRDDGTRGPSEVDPEEDKAIEHADKTATRWGTPVSEPCGGYCQNCIYFIRIDGHFAFLEYGVCTSKDSPLDGRAVHLKSGCQAFTAE